MSAMSKLGHGQQCKTKSINQLVAYGLQISIYKSHWTTLVDCPSPQWDVLFGWFLYGAIRNEPCIVKFEQKSGNLTNDLTTELEQYILSCGKLDHRGKSSVGMFCVNSAQSVAIISETLQNPPKDCPLAHGVPSGSRVCILTIRVRKFSVILLVHRSNRRD